MSAQSLPRKKCPHCKNVVPFRGGAYVSHNKDDGTKCIGSGTQFQRNDPPTHTHQYPTNPQTF